MAEGKAEFKIPGVSKKSYTWYKVVGDLDSSNSTPLIVVHGLPGASHDYLLPLTDLTPETPIVFYDQIGGGRSTHFQEKVDDKLFWSVDLFKRELDSLILHLGLDNRPFDLYGQSWGGILAASWASEPSSLTKNLRRLVISNAAASVSEYVAGLVELRSKLPKDVRTVLESAVGAEDSAKPEVQAALEVFNKKHMSLARPWPPKEVLDLFEWSMKDPTVTLAMYGPNVFEVTGVLRGYSLVSSLHNIKVPTLLIDGTEDTVAGMQRFFQHIDKVKWITLDKAAHLTHVDQREKYMKHLGAFLRY